MDIGAIPRARPWACPWQAELLGCVIALLMGEARDGSIRPDLRSAPRLPTSPAPGLLARRSGERGLRDLAGAKDLRGLDLFGTRVDDDGLEHLGRLTELKALYLESTPVGDEGLAHLRRLTGLHTLAAPARGSATPGWSI